MVRASICIPTVNRIHFFKETLKSATEQTFRDYEVVVSDNSADPDYARELDLVVKETAATTEVPIRVLRQRSQLTIGENARFLFEEARGEFRIHLPDDDRMLPRCLEILIAALEERPEAGFAFCDHWIMDEQGNIDRAASESHSRDYHRTDLDEGFIPHARLFDLAIQLTIPLQTTLFIAGHGPSASNRNLG